MWSQISSKETHILNEVINFRAFDAIHWMTIIDFLYAKLTKSHPIEQLATISLLDKFEMKPTKIKLDQLFVSKLERVDKFIDPFYKNIIVVKMKQLLYFYEIFILMERKDIEYILLKEDLQVYLLQRNLLHTQDTKQLQSQISYYTFLIASHIILLMKTITQNQSINQKYDSTGNFINFQQICFKVTKNILNHQIFAEEYLKKDMHENALTIFSDIFNLSNNNSIFLFENIFELKQRGQGKKQCFLTTTLISFEGFNTIKRNNVGKFINIQEFLKTSMNHQDIETFLLSVFIEKLYFNQNTANCVEGTEVTPWCLTKTISFEKKSKILYFTLSLPPQIRPLSYFDMLSYQSFQVTPAFIFRIASVNYWEQNGQSQFMQVFYNCGKNNIEWISFSQKDTTSSICMWNEEQIKSLAFKGQHFMRTIQKPKQVIIVPSGHRYFWKVLAQQSKQLGVLLNWFILPVIHLQSQKYLQLSEVKPHRIKVAANRLFLSFLSHEYLNLKDANLVELLKSKILTYLQQQQLHFFNAWTNSSHHKKYILQETVSSRYSYCLSCGSQILNYYILINRKIFCCFCYNKELLDEKNPLLSQGFSQIFIGFMEEIAVFRTFFDRIDSFYDKSSKEETNKINCQFEKAFCQAKFSGQFNQNNCKSQLQDQIHLNNHVKTLPSQKMELLYTCERLIHKDLCEIIEKYACAQYVNHLEKEEATRYLSTIANYCERKQQVCFKISPNYSSNNLVLTALNYLNR